MELLENSECALEGRGVQYSDLTDPDERNKTFMWPTASTSYPNV